MAIQAQEILKARERIAEALEEQSAGFGVIYRAVCAAGERGVLTAEAMAFAALPPRASAGLQEFGRYVNDLEYRAKQTLGAEDARAFLNEFLKEIGYEQHLYDNEDSEKAAATRWRHLRSRGIGGQPWPAAASPT